MVFLKYFGIAAIIFSIIGYAKSDFQEKEGQYKYDNGCWIGYWSKNGFLTCFPKPTYQEMGYSYTEQQCKKLATKVIMKIDKNDNIFECDKKLEDKDKQVVQSAQKPGPSRQLVVYPKPVVAETPIIRKPSLHPRVATTAASKPSSIGALSNTIEGAHWEIKAGKCRIGYKRNPSSPFVVCKPVPKDDALIKYGKNCRELAEIVNLLLTDNFGSLQCCAYNSAKFNQFKKTFG